MQTELYQENEEQKQRLIDIFINSVYVYDDRLVVFLNYKDGERCITFDEVECIKKENTHIECSSFVTVGDPYGN